MGFFDRFIFIPADADETVDIDDQMIDLPDEVRF